MPGFIDTKYDSFFSNVIGRLVPMSKKEMLKADFTPKRIIYNDPATIVFWRDGTKTVVKRSKKEKWNAYNAFCAALAKKIFGNNSTVNRIVDSGIDQKAKEKK